MEHNTPKRILLVTSHFYPENFKANDMAFELARRGNDVTVLAPIPDYPQGRYYEGYGILHKRSETIRGVKIIRTVVIPRRNGKGLWLSLNYLSHTLFSTIRGFWLGLTKKYDAVLVHETSPVLIAIPGVIVKKMQNIPLYFWVLDLWPESISAASRLKNRQILSLFGKITRWLYNNSTKILISSKGFRKSICEMGDFKDKIEFFPNWVDSTLTDANSNHDISFPNGFNVVFAGNIGDAQDMPQLLIAAEKVQHLGINLVIVGDGRKKAWVEKEVSERNLNNVYLLGRFPLDAMPEIFSKADLLVVSLKDNPIFALTVPAKLQAYMSSGKPVVAMINGEGADVIREADCGWSVNAENGEALGELLSRIKDLPSEELLRKGANGLEYSRKYYCFDKCMDNLESIMDLQH